MQIALDPAQLGRLNVERAAASAGQLVDADLELPLTGPEEQPGAGQAQTDRPTNGKIGQKKPPPDIAQTATPVATSTTEMLACIAYRRLAPLGRSRAQRTASQRPVGIASPSAAHIGQK